MKITKLHSEISQTLIYFYKMQYDRDKRKAFYKDNVRFEFDYSSSIYSLTFLYKGEYMCTHTVDCSKYTYEQLNRIFSRYIANCFSIVTTLNNKAIFA